MLKQKNEKQKQNYHDVILHYTVLSKGCHF